MAQYRIDPSARSDEIARILHRATKLLLARNLARPPAKPRYPMRLIDAKRAAEAQKMSPRNLVNFAAPQPKNILAAHAHGAAEFPLARQLIQHIEIFVVAVYEKKRGGEISFYIFARHKLIYPLAPKQPKISEHDDEIIGAKPVRKGLVRYFADLVYAAKDVIVLYYKTNEALFMLSVSYLIIILPLSLALTLLEKRLAYMRG